MKCNRAGLATFWDTKRGKEELWFFDLINRVTVILGNASTSPKRFETVIESPFCFRVKIQSPLRRKVHSSTVILFPFLLFSFFFQCKMYLMNIMGVLMQHRTERAMLFKRYFLNWRISFNCNSIFGKRLYTFSQRESREGTYLRAWNQGFISSVIVRDNLLQWHKTTVSWDTG